MSELVPIQRFRSRIPVEHRASLDTRVVWLWHQRFGTVQTVYNQSPDVLDVTAATLILQAIMARDLTSISQLYNRIEGGALLDQTLQDQDAPVRI
jgi:hypothetical protein